MIVILLIVFFFLAVLFLIDSKNAVVNNAVMIIIGVVLVAIAGFRGPDIDRDYYVYKNYWFTKNISGTVEESFVIIRDILKYNLFLSITTLFVVYAVLGVYAKLIGIRVMAYSFYASVLVYFSHYFILHEFTQIRVGVATGFMIIALYFAYKRNLYWFLVVGAIAILFHYSLVFLLPLYFLGNGRNLKLFYLLIPVGYAYYFMSNVMNVNIPIPYFQERIETYQTLQDLGFIEVEEVNIFNAVLLVRITLLYTFFYFADKIAEVDRKIYLLVKIYAISIFSFLFLAKMPVFAFRISELLGVVEILIIPYLLLIIRNRLLGKFAIIGIALVFLLFNLFYLKLVADV